MHTAGTTTSWVVAVVAAALGLAQAACQSSAAAGAQQLFDRRYEAISRMLRDAAAAPVPLVPAEQAWTLRLAATPSGPGALDEQRIYVPLGRDGLVALERETGRLAWMADIAVEGPISVGNDRVFVPGAGILTALEAASGAVAWTSPLENPLRVQPVADYGWLIGIAEPGTVLAFRAADGSLIWRRPLESTTAHRPAIDGITGVLYLTLADGRVIALTGDTGRTLWQRTLPGTLSQPEVARDRVFVGSTDNFFYTLDARTGATRWKWRNGGDVIGAAVDGDVVYFASLDNIMRAVNLSNGNQRWRRPTGTRPLLPPVAFRGIVLVPGVQPAVTVFVGTTGEVMGTLQANGDLAGPPLVDPSPQAARVAIVTITREGVVEALRPSALLFLEDKVEPVPALPGRPLAREATPSDGS